MDCADPSIATRDDRAGATLHSPATKGGDVRAGCARARPSGEYQGQLMQVDQTGKDRGDYSFIRKLISNAIDSQNILRLTRLDFNFMANIFDVCIDRALIRFKRDHMNCIR